MKKITNSSTAYWVYGNEQAPKTIILIHGYRGTHHGLELIAKELNNYKVIVPDLPGFGQSGEHKNYFLTNYVDWLEDFFQEMGFLDKTPKKQKPHLLGHSFGSIIVSGFAEKNQNKVDKLILLNPIPAPVSEAKNIADFFGNGYYKIGEKLPSKLASKWFSSKMTTLIASEFMIKNRTRSNRKYINNAHLEHFSDYKNIQSLIESYEASSKNSVKEFAPNINNETLIIVGDKDDIAPLKKQLELKKLFKNATFEIINGVGHLTHYETPKEVSKLINNYLSLTKSK